MSAAPSSRAHLITLLLLLAALVALSVYALLLDAHVQIDEQVSLFVLSFRNPVVDHLALAITMLADLHLSTTLIIILVLVLIVDRRWWPACYVLCAYFSTHLSVTIIKVLTQRPRPALTDSVVTLMSFPSGHAARAVFVFGAIALISSYGRSVYVRQVALSIASMCSVFIIVSRVYLGVHWSSDVIAGAILGAVALTAVDGLFTVQQEKHIATSIVPLYVVGSMMLAYAGYGIYGFESALSVYGMD